MFAKTKVFSNLLAVSIPSLILSMLGTGCFTKAPVDEPIVQRISSDTLKLSAEGLKNIKLTKAEVGEFPDQLSLMGRVSVPEDRVTVVPARVSGRVDAVYVASGEVVGKGHLLATIFSSDYVVAREEYVQTLRSAKTSPDDPDTKNLLALSRKKLLSLGLLSVDIDQFGTGEHASDNMPIRSPRGGALLDKKVSIGTFVNPGDTMFTVGEMSKVWFSGDIYPEDLPKVHKNQDVEIESPNGGANLTGKVSFISPVIDPTSRTIKIRALMDNPGNSLKADMYVKGSLILSKRQALLTPKSSLFQLSDGVYCFRRLQSGSFQRVKIESSGEIGGKVAISSGLKDGDEVVSDGALLLDAALKGSGT